MVLFICNTLGCLGQQAAGNSKTPCSRSYFGQWTKWLVAPSWKADAATAEGGLREQGAAATAYREGSQ